MPEYPENWKEMNIVLAHDWLTGMRGGERVLELLCSGFPAATVCTLIHNRTAISDTINSHPIVTSSLQRLPGVVGYYRYLLPFMPSAIERMSPPESDLIISTSHCVAKGLKSRPGTRHLCYCFTPMRYAWTFYDEYFGGNTVKKMFLKPVLARMRAWDRSASDRIDRFVAISEHVRKRIREFYDRDADVVFPPVDLDYYTPGGQVAADFDLVVSALVPYKRIDLAVRAYTRTGYPLKIIGVGTETNALKKLAGGNIEFLGWQSYGVIREMFRNCRQLIFPGEEDFGLVPVEVQACGRPVVAFGRGGILETVNEGESGIFFESQTEDALIAAVEHSAAMKWDLETIRKSALRFSIGNFISGLDESISRVLA